MTTLDQAIKEQSKMAEQPKGQKRKQARRPSIGALMAATEDQRRSMASILAEFKELPEPLKVIVASQVRREMENGS